MQLERSVVRRFRSDVARLAPGFDRVTLGFFARLRRDCPHVMRVVPAWTKRNRYHLAAAFSEFVRHAEDPTLCLPRLAHALASAGLTEQDLRIMQRALIHEVRDAAGAEWTEQMQSDWTAVLHSVFAGIRCAASAPQRAAA